MPLFLLLIFIVSCTPKQEKESASTTVEESRQMQEPTTIDTTAETATVPDQEETSQVAQRTVTSPIGQKIEMVPEILGSLCGNKYGCIEQGIYPLGWSADGKFAYLLEGANEAVNDYSLQLFIQDMETDKIVADKLWKASDQPGWTEEQDHNFSSVWANEATAFRKVLEAHQIREGSGNDFIRLPYQVDGQRYEFKSNNSKTLSDYTGSEIISEHQLQVVAGSLGQKRILRQKFGKYEFVLATQVLGLFKSPFEDRVAVLDGAEYRGYEGPPNVLKFKLVGCDLKEGY